MKPLRMVHCMLLLLSVSIGCGDVNEPGEEYLGLTNPVFRRWVQDPGELHNRIAREYAARRDLSRPVERAAFVGSMVEACNAVFQEKGIPPIVVPADIHIVLNEILRLRDEGVFDFFASDPGDPRDIVRYWAEKGMVPPTETAAILARLSAPSDVEYPTDQGSSVVRFFDGVYFSSRELWTLDPMLSQVFDARFPMSNHPGDESVPPKLVFQVDSIGTLFGWFLGGPLGGSIGTIVFSWAIYEMPPGGGSDDGWECSDYCNMAGPEGGRP